MSDYFGEGWGLLDTGPDLYAPTPAVAPVTVTPAAFRLLLPEFADAAKWPDAAVAAWLTVGAAFVDPIRWGDAATLGVALYAAHNLVLGLQAANAVAGGAVPGAAGGVVSSKSVGPLSKSYDTNLGTLDGAGAWNLTDYGVRYQQLLPIFGAGCVQL